MKTKYDQATIIWLLQRFGKYKHFNTSVFITIFLSIAALVHNLKNFIIEVKMILCLPAREAFFHIFSKIIWKYGEKFVDIDCDGSSYSAKLWCFSYDKGYGDTYIVTEIGKYWAIWRPYASGHNEDTYDHYDEANMLDADDRKFLDKLKFESPEDRVDAINSIYGKYVGESIFSCPECHAYVQMDIDQIVPCECGAEMTKEF
jgi:hypothetical protein